ncbi:hypothetical protein AMTRI_Chr11g155020 [Amborella trichopoda]
MGRKGVLASCFFLNYKTDKAKSCLVFSFYDSLSEALLSLRNSLGTRAFVDLQWCVQAMKILSTMHTGLLLLLIDNPSLRQKWLDQYMDHTIFLLDVCNSLKAAVSSLEKYRLLTEFTIESIKGHTRDPEVLVMEMQRLTMKKNELQGSKSWAKMAVHRCEEWGVPPLRLSHVMRDAQGVVAMVASLLVSVVVTSGVHVGGGGHPIGALDPAGSTMFTQMGEDMWREAGLLEEVERVESVVEEIGEELVGGWVEDEGKLCEIVEVLKRRSNHLKEGLERFEGVVDQVFNEVVDGRNKILHLFGDGT